MAKENGGEVDPKKAAELAEIEELEGKYGVLGEDFIFCKAGSTRIVLRRPDPDDYDKGQNNLRNSRVKKSAVLRQICYDAAAEPDKEKLEAVFARYPHLPITLADELSILAGSDIQAVVKKG